MNCGMREAIFYPRKNYLKLLVVKSYHLENQWMVSFTSKELDVRGKCYLQNMALVPNVREGFRWVERCFKRM